MRALYVIFFLLMLVFVAVQYNDPDAPLWILYYGVVAVWCAMAFFRPGLLRGTPLLRGLALASLAFYVLGFLWEIRTFNPDFLGRTMMDAGVETTREAFGLLICAAITAFALWGDGRTAPALRAQRS